MLLRLTTCLTAVCVALSIGDVPEPPASGMRQADAFAVELQSRLSADKTLEMCFSGGYRSIATDGCRSLDEAAKKTLAVHFSRCLLHASRRPVSACDDAELERLGFSACTANMSAEEFDTFTKYAAHVDLLCWHVESREWQATVGGAVRNLLAGANTTAHALVAVKRTADQMRESHNAAISAGAAAMREVEARQVALAEAADRIGSSIAASTERYTSVAAAIAQLSEYATVLLHLQGYLVG